VHIGVYTSLPEVYNGGYSLPEVYNCGYSLPVCERESWWVY